MLQLIQKMEVGMNKDYIYHHGILGMKWGKKNGPPYPLDASDHSASEKKAGWRRSLSKNQKKEAKQTGRSELTDRQKKAYFKNQDVLTKKGLKFNKQEQEKFNRRKESLKSNISNVDKKYNQLVQEYLEIKEKNNIQYLKNKEEWYKNTDGPFKNVDYYKFKDIAADMWLKSDYGKKESEVRKSLEKIVEHSFKESPYKDFSYLQLTGQYEYDSNKNDLYQNLFLERIDYGKTMVNSIMNDIDSEAIRNQYRRYEDVPLEKRNG